MTRCYCIVVVLLSTAFCSARHSLADFVAFTDFSDWQNAAGSFHTITFLEHSPGTVVTSQYDDLGVVFFGSPPAFISTGFAQDENGLQSFGEIFLDFAVPQLEFGAHYPGTLLIEVFSDGEQVFIDEFILTGFGGVVSDQPFDSIRLTRVTGPPVFVDNIYFTIPAPGALALFGLGALLCASRRRRAA